MRILALILNAATALALQDAILRGPPVKPRAAARSAFALPLIPVTRPLSADLEHAHTRIRAGPATLGGPLQRGGILGSSARRGLRLAPPCLRPPTQACSGSEAGSYTQAAGVAMRAGREEAGGGDEAAALRAWLEGRGVLVSDQVGSLRASLPSRLSVCLSVSVSVSQSLCLFVSLVSLSVPLAPPAPPPTPTSLSLSRSVYHLSSIFL